jgi:hypothetical protein
MPTTHLENTQLLLEADVAFVNNTQLKVTLTKLKLCKRDSFKGLMHSDVSFPNVNNVVVTRELYYPTHTTRMLKV